MCVPHICNNSLSTARNCVYTHTHTHTHTETHTHQMHVCAPVLMQNVCTTQMQKLIATPENEDGANSDPEDYGSKSHAAQQGTDEDEV